MSFTLLIQVSERKTLSVTVSRGVTLEELKNLCYDRLGFKPEEFNLMRGTKILDSNASFTTKNETLRLQLKLRGGRSTILTGASFEGPTREERLGLPDSKRPWLSCSLGFGIKSQCDNWKHKSSSPCPVVERSNGYFIEQKGLGAFQLSDNIRCPECGSKAKIVTFVFAKKCEFSINGRYQDPETNTPKTVSRSGEVTDEKSYVIFKPLAETTTGNTRFEWSWLHVQACKPTRTQEQ